MSSPSWWTFRPWPSSSQSTSTDPMTPTSSCTVTVMLPSSAPDAFLWRISSPPPRPVQMGFLLSLTTSVVHSLLSFPQLMTTKVSGPLGARLLLQQRVGVLLLVCVGVG